MAKAKNRLDRLNRLIEKCDFADYNGMGLYPFLEHNHYYFHYSVDDRHLNDAAVDFAVKDIDDINYYGNGKVKITLKDGNVYSFMFMAMTVLK